MDLFDLPKKHGKPLLGICPREMKISVHTKTCAPVFITALFVMAKQWETSQCLSTDGQNRCDAMIVEYYSALKRNEIPTPPATWTNLRNMMFSERRQTRRATDLSTHSIYMKCPNLQTQKVGQRLPGVGVGGGENGSER